MIHMTWINDITIHTFDVARAIGLEGLVHVRSKP